MKTSCIIKKFNFVKIPRNQFTDHPHFAPRLTLTFRLKCQSWWIEKFNYKHLTAKLSTTTRTWRLYKIVKWKMPWLIHPSTRRGKLNACQTSRWNIVVNISLREEAEEWVEEELHGIADQQIVAPTKWRQTNRRKHLPYVEMQFSLFISLTFSDSFENYFPHFPLSTLRIAYNFFLAHRTAFVVAFDVFAILFIIPYISVAVCRATWTRRRTQQNTSIN